MRNLKSAGKLVFAAGVCGVIGVGLWTGVAEAKPPRPGPGGCFCATYYDPVLCSNGVTYSNQCFANCAGATGCVPTGPGPIPVGQ